MSRCPVRTPGGPGGLEVVDTAAAGDRVTGMRTCVGCRSKAHRSDLVRLVVDRRAAAPVVVVDPRAVMPGRGVWLHQRPDCLDRKSVVEGKRGGGGGRRVG